MKKTIALLLAVFMLAVCLQGVALADYKGNAAAAQASKVTIGELQCDTSGITLGSTQQVTFTAKVAFETALKSADVKVVDDTGNIIAYMRDDGQGQDVARNDGIFTATVMLSQDTAKYVQYKAQVGAAEGAERQISYYKEITDDEWKISEDIWKSVKALEARLDAMDTTDKAIVDNVYKFLSENDYVTDLVYDTPLEISFKFTFGTENIFARMSEEEKSAVGKTDYASEIAEAISEKNTKEGNYIDTPAIGVWSPYYGYDSNFTYNYRTRAQAMQSALEIETLDTYYGSDASVESFKKWDRYGIIMVDSHGAANNGGGYICIPAPGSYSSQDVAEGHLIQSGGSIYLKGTFMQKYCNMLPNSIIYIGICYGMAAGNLYTPLLSHGAGFICGYDDSVSFVFDGQIMNSFHTFLYTENPSTGELYTTGEAFQAACSAHGSVDPYSSNRAEFIYRGNTSLRAKATLVPVESIQLSPAEVTSYNANNIQFTCTVLPEDANRVTINWESSALEVASISQTGMATTISEGVTTITCTVTDNSVSPAAVYTDTAVINCLGNLAVTGIEVDAPTVELFMNAAPTQIMAHVLPVDATEKGISYESLNPDVVTVDANGFATALSCGVAIIKLTTNDGGFVAYTVCTVAGTNRDAALNLTGGALAFTDDNQYPWTIVNMGDRIVMRSGNPGQNATRSTMKLDAGLLPAGTILNFDWRVSSEDRWDSLNFLVNDAAVSLVPAISGISDWESVSYAINTESSYVFSWYFAKDTSISAGEDCGWLDNVEIIIPGKAYEVKFMSFENVLSSQQVSHGMSATAPLETAADGYIFLGWDKQFSEIRSDVTINAVYIPDPNYVPPQKFSVTFADKDGNVIDTQEIEEGKGATAPTPPTYDGYLFLHWDTEFSNITGDTTVTAVYGRIGDANCDGVVNTGDACMILRHNLSMIRLEGDALLLADVNANGEVNTGDASAVLAMVIQ